jgi:AraC-like DNA-binding protein
MEAGHSHGCQPPATALSAWALSDVLGEFLENARLSGCICNETILTMPLHMESESGAVRFYILRHGHCRIEIEGGVAFADLNPGDVVVETEGLGHSFHATLTQTATRKKIDASGKGSRLRKSASSALSSLTTLITGRFFFDTNVASPLLSSLPPLIHIAATSKRAGASFADIAELMVQESNLNRSCSQAIVNCLAQVLFIQAVREYVTSFHDNSHLWLSAAMDPEIGAALRFMHAEPERNWTVASLAGNIGLSRSVFASRFKALVTKPPRQYLRHCRMSKACRLLLDSKQGIKQIAKRVGYATNAAFCNAFKQWSGTSPGAFRHRARRGNSLNNHNSDHG